MGEEKSSWYDEQLLLVDGGIEVRRKDLPKYRTADLFEAVKLWKDWKRFGLFHGSGPHAETAEYIQILSELEDVMEAARTPNTD